MADQQSTCLERIIDRLPERWKDFLDDLFAAPLQSLALIFCVVCMLFFLGLTIAKIQAIIEIQAFLGRASQIQGTVLDVSSSGGGSDPNEWSITCNEHVTFWPAGRESITFFISETWTGDCHKALDHVTIFYDPHNLSAARIADFTYYDRRVDIIFAVLFSIFWLAPLAEGLRELRQKRQRRQKS